MRAGWIRLTGKELSDKWQIPTFGLAIVLASLAVYHLLAQQKRTSIEDYVRQCRQLAQKRDYVRAASLTTELLNDASIGARQRGELQCLAAQIIYETELQRDEHSPARLKVFHRYFTLGTQGQKKLSPAEHRMLANVYQWENQPSEAVDHLQAALEAGSPDRTAILRQIIELLPRTGRNIRDEYRQKLDELLADGSLRSDDLVWALDLKTELLFNDGQFQQAVDAIRKAMPRVTDPQDRLHLQYSLALGQFSQDRLDQAEPTLRDILDKLANRNELEAKVGLLLGRICAKDDRPQEAGAFYDQVIDSHPLTDYHLAALVGKGQADVVLHRYEEAQAKYEEAFGLLDRLGPNKLVTREQILASVESAADGLFKNGDLSQALALAHVQDRYLDQADDRTRQVLLSKIGTWHRQRAEQLDRQSRRVTVPELAQQLETQSRDNYRSAGDYFLRLSRTPGLIDRNAALELWKAATCYENGGLPDEAEAMLEKFIRDWPNDANIPEALFKLAKLHQAKNELTQAQDYYRRLINEFTRTPFGQQSLIPLAQCYFSRGPKFYGQAEQILRDMVDDTSNQQQFKPDSAEFRDAVFLLGKVYYYKGEYEQCVGRLEEALERYPNDRSEPEARFLIAQSYRKIAEQTDGKIAQTNDRQLKAILARSREQNLQRAQELYQLAIPVFEKMPNRSPLEDTYLQLAYIYSADTLYDLNRYDQAIRAYERVIEKYEKTPLALDSYVQIANSFQRLGQVGKIKAVLERMKWLLRQMPDQALAAPDRPFSRKDWENWIDWNYRSGLLEPAAPGYLAKGADQAGS